MKFTELNLNEKVLKGIEDAGFEECTAVQALTLAETLKGRDVAVQSRTGTGKTAAFLITIYQLICEEWTQVRKKALIIVPTRELAVQIEKEAALLGGHLDVTMGSIYGGVGYAAQEKILGIDADIIIGTPGRLLDFSRSGKLKLGERGILVIDEADRLFDMGFLPDLRRMLRGMPPPDRRMTMLFSATLDAAARELAWEHMNDPVEIAVTPDRMLVEEVSQELYHVGLNEKMPLLLGIMRKDNPQNVLIFTNTKHDAYELSKRLEYNGYRSTYMIGDLPQSKRLAIIGNLKSGKVRYLVATDVAARGLHVNDLEMVINYDIPQDFENYVHRIGRTARAGRPGRAVTFACEKYVYGLDAIETYIGMKIPVVWPDDEFMVSDASAGMRFRLADKGREPRLKARGEARDRQPRRRKKSASGRLEKAGQERVKKETTGHETARRDQALKPPGEKKPSRTRKEREGRSRRRLTGDLSREERLAYYQSKYGDTFMSEFRGSADAAGSTRLLRDAPGATHDTGGGKMEKPSLIKRIRRFLGGS
ncbi:MAG: DEAD/DEAH box helicase [Syntrophales bacterium]|nr:DEAD/DEAH box helicase [Syntrophales bacterium]MCK9527570.1 DEAD/DEAH box helicase [Syntrophales bacterium]MDX9922627.1 DEAD/DEAH box helicase [Syntrophales bacterium]